MYYSLNQIFLLQDDSILEVVLCCTEWRGDACQLGRHKLLKVQLVGKLHFVLLK